MTTVKRPRRGLWRWLKALLALSTVVFVAGFAYTRGPAFGATPSGQRQLRIEQSSQWDTRRFVNRQPQWLDLRKALREAVFGEGNAHANPDAPIAVVHTDAAQLAQPAASGLRVTWFGHSSTLVEIDGVRVLTDPFWGERASPVDWAGPKRFFAAPIGLRDLPPIDAVVISHDHYDHLDRATVEQLRDTATVFVVPLGIGAHLERWGIPPSRIRELDWWETTKVGDLDITATPARHASGRLSNDSGRTLWAGYALHGPEHRVWYSGDTGFHDQLDDIGERLGPFDLTLLDAGQYNPLWPDAHLGPEQAVEAHRLVKGRTMVPVHWGLLNLAPHTWTEPVERVRVQAACRGVDLLILQPGRVTEPEQPGEMTAWWPSLPWKTARERAMRSTLAGDPVESYPPFDCAHRPWPMRGRHRHAVSMTP
ncbi:MBL fold metallo-hydrolase [Thermomonas sp. HDW16]|nr:MBL fold metallo-hydrolase [Thermomonas sp. HDW16]